jgi:hypothetical protein
LGIALGLQIEDVKRNKEYLKKLREEEKALSSKGFSDEAKDSVQKTLKINFEDITYSQRGLEPFTHIC